MGDATELVRSERVALIDLLDTLTPQEWATSSLCDADLAIRWSQRGTAAILEQLRRNAADDARPVGVPDAAVIADAVIHGLDIHRPLGRSRPIPGAAFVTLPEFFLNLRWPLSVSVGGSARKRVRGLRLVASDLNWSHGTGPEVRTSSEALLLVLSGRPVEAAELSGTEAVELFHRL